ncbi:MAG: ion transporter [Minwuiales bacterium]|nr:ion transporter [Minwuiales bacterium]
MTRRQRLFRILEGEGPSEPLGRVVNAGIVALILVNVTAVILESVGSLHARYSGLFWTVEAVSVAAFTVEYAARVWVSREAGGRLRYMLSPMALVDLVAILPFYLGFLIAADLRFLRALRLLRLFKLTRHFAAIGILADVMRAEARAFGAAILVMLILMVIAASGMHLVEHRAQPEAFGSIPAAMWWAMVTLTTVGYGDVTPITSMGKLIGAVIMVMGIGMVALPAGMLASRFSDELAKRRAKFRHHVGEAQRDGTVDAAEQAELEDLRLRLCLSRSDVEHMLADDGVCPTCGRR